jgi:hypothetical protein
VSIGLRDGLWPAVPQAQKAAGEALAATTRFAGARVAPAQQAPTLSLRAGGMNREWGRGCLRVKIMNVERLVISLCALIGVAALFLFGRHVWHASAPKRESPGITVRSEILTIYAPKALIEFAKAHPEITTNDELVRLIRQSKLNVWFAIVARNHQADGIFADVPIWYRAGERPECFDNTKAVLLTLAGNRPGPGTVDYTNARTEVIDDALMKMEPVEGLRQLLTQGKP